MTTHHPTPGEDGTGRSAAEAHRPVRYQIRVVGHLGPKWAAWFDGLDMTNEPDGTCLIRGAVVDQTALHGLLNKVRDIGLPLESLTRIGPDGSTNPTSPGLDPTDNNPSGATS